MKEHRKREIKAYSMVVGVTIACIIIGYLLIYFGIL